jgi:hypothetical protein
MSYKPSNSDSFGEYQLGEGFGAAVHGDVNKTDKIARLAQQGANHLPAGLQGLDGYVSYPSSLREYPNYGEGGDEEDDPSAIALSSTGLDGYETAEAFAGFEGIEDDAFAGYSLGETMKAVSQTAQSSALEEDEDEDEDGGFDGYGTLAGTPEESFHTFFHKASMANTGSGLIKELGKAVKTVNLNTPMAVRKQYYDLAKDMIIRRKKTNLKHLDIQRAEIESNIGWLINPGLPQTGGFNAVLRKAVGTVGAKLGKGDKDDLKSMQAMAIGNKLKAGLTKRHQLSGLAGFGEGSKLSYVGLAVAGIAVAGLIYYLCKTRAAAPALKKRKRRKRK